VSDPSTETWRAALGQSTSAQLRQTQAALAKSQADLTSKYATIVELLAIIDAFQVESGADRNACSATGIEAVRRMREDLAAANHRNRILTAENEAALRALNEKEGTS
jgi:hypothetical protein